MQLRKGIGFLAALTLLAGLWGCSAQPPATNTAPATGSTETVAASTPETSAPETTTPETTTPEAATPQTTTGAPEAAGYPLTLEDQLKRSVTIQAQPKRVVSLTPSTTEILFALGCGASVVGVDSYSNYPPETADLPKAGDYSGANAEQVVALNPDLVMTSSKLQAESIEALAALKLNVYSAEPTGYADIIPNIETIAKIMGVDAKPLIDTLTAREKAVVERVQALEKPKVYYAVSFGEMGDYSVGEGSFLTDLIEKAGGVCVTKELATPWPTVSPEQIIAYDPDVIVIGGTPDMVEAFSTTPAFKELRAVKEGKVYAIDADIVSRPAPRLFDALEEMAKLLHP